MFPEGQLNGFKLPLIKVQNMASLNKLPSKLRGCYTLVERPMLGLLNDRYYAPSVISLSQEVSGPAYDFTSMVVNQSIYRVRNRTNNWRSLNSFGSVVHNI